MRTGNRIFLVNEDRDDMGCGRVVKVETQTDAIDVSMSGILGAPPSTFREHARGRTRTIITLEIE